MENMNEYIALRNEIISSSNYQKGYISLLYTVVAAIFAFAFTQEEPLIFLVPIVVIIPIYLLNMRECIGMLKLGCYLQVFYEEDNPGWETRLKNYHQKFKDIKSDIAPYIFLSFCGPVICGWRLFCSGLHNAENILKLIFAFICLAVCLCIIKKYNIDYIECREKYVNDWKIIKQEENNNIKCKEQT